MKTLTVRNVPEDVAERLAKRASESHTSVNSLVVALLSKILRGGNPFAPKRNLGEFCGTWSDEEYDAFNEATESTRRIEPEDWQ